MDSECAKCLEKLIHKEDTLECNTCKKTVHFYCAGISESNFKKMSKLNKGKYACSDHKQTDSNTKNIQPSVKVETKIDELIQSVEFMGKQFDNFNNKLDSLVNEVKNLKIENAKMKNENNNLLNEVSIIKFKIDTLEQSNLIKSIDITGIPQTPNENCTEIVKEIGLKTNTKINVIEANRQYFTNNTNSIIVAKLETIEMKKNLIRNSKICKISANNLHSAWSNKNNIYINERLTKDRRSLYGKARAYGKEKNYKFVWVNNGDILMKKDEKSKTLRIRNLQDFDKA